ncbi:hypothetical protein ACFQ6C_26500 [Streptomyces sp. NPDC056454]
MLAIAEQTLADEYAAQGTARTCGEPSCNGQQMIRILNGIWRCPTC